MCIVGMMHTFNVCFVSVSGNLIVVIVILVNRKMRTVTNFFLANLAVADFCVGIFCVIPNLFRFLMPNRWIFGNVSTMSRLDMLLW